MYTSSWGRRSQQRHVTAPAGGDTWPVAAPDSGDTRSAGCCKTADFQRSEAGLGGSSPGLVGSIPAASPAQVAGDLLPGYHGPAQPSPAQPAQPSPAQAGGRTCSRQCVYSSQGHWLQHRSVARQPLRCAVLCVLCVPTCVTETTRH